MKHPCVNKCTAHLSDDGICRGCGRTVKEIAEWNTYNEDQKVKIISREKKRVSKFHN